MDLGRSLDEWLNNLDLGQYLPQFHAAGITEISHLATLDDLFLSDIGISPIGHRKRILDHLPQNGSDEDYVNYPLNERAVNYENEDDSIYANVSNQISTEIPPLLQHSTLLPSSITNATGATASSNSKGKKKPVPQPRASRAVKPSPVPNPNIDISPPSYSSVLEQSEEALQLAGVTNEESCTEESSSCVSSPDAWNTPKNIKDTSKDAHNFTSDFSNVDVKNLTTQFQNDLFWLTHDHSNQLTVSDVSANFADFSKFDKQASDAPVESSETYEPIWMSASDKNADNKSKVTSDSVEKTVSPLAPPPCRTYFPFEGNVNESFGSSSTYPGFDSPISPIKRDFPVENDAVYVNTEDDSNTQIQNKSDQNPPSDVNLFSENVVQQADSLMKFPVSPEVSFEMPPPEFEPPPLPTTTKATNSLSTSLLDFDPLFSSPLPPVPPRVTLSSAVPHDYINIDSKEDDTTRKSPLKDNSRNVYSMADFTDFQITSTPKCKSNVSQSKSEPVYSYATPDENSKKSFTTQISNVSVSSDPFRGEDPFQAHAEFHEECKEFNTQVPDRGNKESTYEQFTFGSKAESSKSPPTCTIRNNMVGATSRQLPTKNAAMYSVALHQNFDLSSDESSDERSIDSVDQSIGMEGCTSPVDILPSMPQKRKMEKAGYLYKQGGVRGNKGWRKRWVVFTGKSLRYYANSKSQISKRIVPLSSMKEVNACVKEHDKDKFKFNLVTTNRIFQFASEKLDDCTLWCSTLMESILKYKPPPGGEKEGLDMNDPDKKGYLKFEKQKYFVVVKHEKMAYYHSEEDYKQGSPIHEIEMKLAAVKEIGSLKLQLSTHYAHFLLFPENYQDCVLWKMAFEESIADGLGDNTILEQVRENASNRLCADCSAPDPHWASINMGIVICKKCAGIHRNFDHTISRVKSLRMDTKIWTPSLVEMMKAIGNSNSRLFWEKKMPPDKKINEDTPSPQRKTHIENKYKAKLYCDKISISENQKALNEMLIVSVQSENLLETMKILFSGANIYSTNGSGENAYQVSKRAGQRLTMEFLFQNGGDRTSSVYSDSEEIQAARLRGEVCLEGYLLKTGSKKKDFLKRWCVLEHGCLRYFSNEKESSVAKADSVDRECMLCVQATPILDKYPEAFELSTSARGNREYLFAASSPEEKMTWLRALAKLFCPLSLMEDVGQSDFILAGNFNVREVARDWERTWLTINRRTLEFTDKENNASQKIDLRKAYNTQYSETVEACSFCTENGPVVALDVHGRSLYFQADLSRDSDRLLKAFSKAMKSGGETLQDQHLSQSNVPVIVEKCVHFIEDNGIKEEGIYRLAGQKSKVQALLDRFMADANSTVLQQGVHQVHEVASCLKLFFRGLKDPLFMSSKYNLWIENAGRMDPTVKLEWYQHLLRQLPTENYNTLKRLVLHFIRLSKHADLNKMNKQNIAIAFGPTLMEAQNEVSSKGTNDVQLQMLVIGDIMKYHQELFEIDNSEDEIQRNVERGREIIERLTNSNANRLSINDSLRITVFILSPKSQSSTQEINIHTKVKHVVDQLKLRLRYEGDYTLHEVICDGALERPLHNSDYLHGVVRTWWDWPEIYRKQVCLCMKPNSELLDKLSGMYDPSKSLFADLRMIEKKPTMTSKATKYSFQFKQSRLSYFKVNNPNSPLGSWNIEDLAIYYGLDPLTKKSDKCGITFIKAGEIPGSKETPLFGRGLCFPNEMECLAWMASMLMAQHSEGFT